MSKGRPGARAPAFTNLQACSADPLNTEGVAGRVLLPPHPAGLFRLRPETETWTMPACPDAASLQTWVVYEACPQRWDLNQRPAPGWL